MICEVGGKVRRRGVLKAKEGSAWRRELSTVFSAADGSRTSNHISQDDLQRTHQLSFHHICVP